MRCYRHTTSPAMEKKNPLLASSGSNILAQNSPVEGREIRDASRSSQNPPVQRRVKDTSKQLTIWKSPQSPEARLFRHKPQIVSILGICPKEKNRYRVVLGGELLGERLTLDEALKLAKGGEV